MTDSQMSAEALNGINATLRRLVFAYEAVNGIELGPRGYYRVEDASDSINRNETITNDKY